jgi:hypothetical protein
VFRLNLPARLVPANMTGNPPRTSLLAVVWVMAIDMTGIMENPDYCLPIVAGIGVLTFNMGVRFYF